MILSVTVKNLVNLFLPELLQLLDQLPLPEHQFYATLSGSPSEPLESTVHPTMHAGMYQSVDPMIQSAVLMNSVGAEGIKPRQIACLFKINCSEIVLGGCETCL
jgi:hypothetical protein